MNENKTSTAELAGGFAKFIMGCVLAVAALIGAIALYAWLFDDSDEIPTYTVQSVEFLDTETPDVINDPSPSIRIVVDDGILLLTPHELDYKKSDDDAYEVLETRGRIHVIKGTGQFIESSAYTIYVPDDQIEELTKQHIDRFGEPIPFIDGEKGD